MKTDEIYQKVTDMIVGELENGRIPWERPWNICKDGSVDAPQNYATKRPYNGVNALILNCAPYERPYYLTFKQAIDLKGNVRKGEKSTIVVFWEVSKFSKENKDGELEEQNAFFLKVYHVFNIAQIDGIDFKLPELQLYLLKYSSI